MSSYRIEPLGEHDRSAFSCGDEVLDGYFRRVIGQDVRRRAASAYVAINSETEEVLGFYTLSAWAIDREHLPARVAAKAPRYSRAPAVLLGRLAVDAKHQGRQLGVILVADALKRALAVEIGAYAMLVQPKNERAQAFYLTRGFEPLEAGSPFLFMPLATAARLFSAGTDMSPRPR